MKKIFNFLPIIWIGLAGVGLLSCDTNSNYEETMEGRLIVLNEPYKCQNWCNGNKYKVVAHFVINKEFSDSLILATLGDTARKYYPHFKICGSIPKEYQKPGIQDVSVSLKAVHSCIHMLEPLVPTGADPYGDWYFYKLTSVNEIQ